MIHSIRVRLTLWNAGLIVVVLLVFSSAAYILLKHGTIEQVDQAGRQQLRDIGMTMRASESKAATPAVALSRAVGELRGRGFAVAFDSLSNTIIASNKRIEGTRVATQDGIIGVSQFDSIAQRAFAVLQNDPSSHVYGTSSRSSFELAGGAGGFRGYVQRVPVGPLHATIAAIEPLDEVDELLTQARTIALVAFPAVVALAGGIGYAQARKALAPVSRMTREAQQIGARNLHERLTIANRQDELGKLAATFNEVLDRVDDAMEQQRQFTADASHELRTPIAIVRSEAEVALDASAPTTEELRAALSVIQSGSVQLSRIVNDMFLLARADAGQASPGLAPIYLNDLVIDVAKSMNRVAEARNIRIDVTAPQDMPMHGDTDLLRRSIANLIDNAIKYAPSASMISVCAASSPDAYHVTVCDAGPGVPPECRPFIFNRFYRVDSARSSNETTQGAGAGLGLAIARELVELHGGSIELRVAEADMDRTTFAITLPRLTANAGH